MSPASNDNGRSIDDLCAELRDRSSITRMCGRCDYTISGTVGDTTVPMQEHLRVVHGVVSSIIRKRRNTRSRFASAAGLDDNIRKARAAGSGTDYEDAA